MIHNLHIWAMTHPWMTFFIVMVGLFVLESCIIHICESSGRKERDDESDRSSE